MNAHDFWNAQLAHIVGKRVVKASMEYVYDFDAEAPVLEFEDGTELMMLSDEEGNNAGSFAYL